MSSTLASWLLLLIGYVAAGVGLWALFTRRHRLSLVLIVTAGLAFRLNTSSDSYLHPWDERYHALVAKNMRAAPLMPMLYRTPLLEYDYRDWETNHVWLHKGPVSLWLMAVSLSTFGLTDFAVRFPSLILATLRLVLTYLIGKRLLGARIGLLAALFQSADTLMVGLCGGRISVDHVDTTFSFLVECAVWLAVLYAARPRLLLLAGVGVVTGLALLTKSTPALLVIPVFFLLTYHRLGKLRSAAYALVVLVLALLVQYPWQRYCALSFPQEYAFERQYEWRHVFEVIEKHAGQPWYLLRRLLGYYGELAFLPLAWLAVMAWRRWEARRLAMLAWWAIPLVVFSFVATKRPNYLAICAPAIALTMSWCWWYLRRGWVRRRWPRASMALLALMLLASLKEPLSHYNPKLPPPRTEAWADELRALRDPLSQAPSVLFNTEHPIEAMFYCETTAYDQIPSAEQVAALTANGHRVYILDGPAIPDDLRNREGVTILPSASAARETP